MSETKENLNLDIVSGSYLTEKQYGINVNGRIFIDELGNKREAELITYDDTGVPYIKWKGRPPIGCKCAYNLRLNTKMKWC